MPRQVVGLTIAVRMLNRPAEFTPSHSRIRPDCQFGCALMHCERFISPDLRRNEFKLTAETVLSPLDVGKLKQKRQLWSGSKQAAVVPARIFGRVQVTGHTKMFRRTGQSRLNPEARWSEANRQHRRLLRAPDPADCLTSRWSDGEKLADDVMQIRSFRGSGEPA